MDELKQSVIDSGWLTVVRSMLHRHQSVAPENNNNAEDPNIQPPAAPPQIEAIPGQLAIQIDQDQQENRSPSVVAAPDEHQNDPDSVSQTESDSSDSSSSASSIPIQQPLGGVASSSDDNISFLEMINL